MADIRNFNGNEPKIKQKNPLRKQSNLRLLKKEEPADYKEKIRKHRLTNLYRTLLIMVVCAAVVLLLFILYRNKKYTDYTVKTTVPQTFVYLIQKRIFFKFNLVCNPAANFIVTRPIFMLLSIVY